MSAAARLTQATGMPMPKGMEVLDLEDLIDEAQHAAAAADDAAQAVMAFVRTAFARTSATDVAKLLALLDLVAGRTAAAVEACDEVLDAHAEGVR